MLEPDYPTHIFDCSNDKEESYLICVGLGEHIWHLGAVRPRDSKLPLAYFSIGSYSLPTDKIVYRTSTLNRDDLDMLLDNTYDSPESVLEFGRRCDEVFGFSSFKDFPNLK